MLNGVLHSHTDSGCHFAVDPPLAVFLPANSGGILVQTGLLECGF